MRTPAKTTKAYEFEARLPIEKTGKPRRRAEYKGTRIQFTLSQLQLLCLVKEMEGFAWSSPK